MIVKICGITNIRDARVAVESGADMLGFIFSPSPRQVNAERVKKIISDLPPEIVTVGVFVNSDRDFVLSAINDCKLEKLQFHGNESPEYCQEFRQGVIKAFRVKDKRVLSYLPKYRVEAYLLDTYFPGQAGGTGRTFNWSIAKEAQKYGKIILSGGLTPENVEEAIKEANPYAVDVSSGVESRPGIKDAGKIAAFILAAKSNSSKTSS